MLLELILGLHLFVIINVANYLDCRILWSFNKIKTDLEGNNTFIKIG